jgi:hypothetical protein
MGMVHHRTTKGKRMTFHDKPWLTAIYKDNAKEMVIIKCSQVHMTEHALCAMFTFAHEGLRGMYILPSKDHRRTFVADRVNRQRDTSLIYANAIKVHGSGDSNVFKDIFGTGWKFVGSNVKGDFFEFPCDVLFFDEYDLLDQDNILYAYDRVADCRRPRIWKFGNPTRADWGISKEWLLSNQNEWHVTCEHCEEEQILDWYVHFVKKSHNEWTLRHPTGRPICTKCGRDFDRLGKGRWIALNPGSFTAGYRISRLFVRKRTHDIIKMFNTFQRAQGNSTALQRFHNNVLGVTYEHAEFKLTDAVLSRCALQASLDDYDTNTFRSVMGVDQGKNFTCTISIVIDGELFDVHYADVKRWGDVEKLEEDWNVVCTVIDAQGGGYADTRDFVEAKGYRWMCYYRPKDQVKKLLNQRYEEHVIETNRTEILDTMVAAMIKQKIHIPQDWQSRCGGAYSKLTTSIVVRIAIWLFLCQVCETVSQRMVGGVRLRLCAKKPVKS